MRWWPAWILLVAPTVRAEPQVAPELGVGVTTMQFVRDDRGVDGLGASLSLAVGPFRGRVAMSQAPQVAAQLGLDLRRPLPADYWIGGGPALVTASGFGGDEPRASGLALDLRIGRRYGAFSTVAELVVLPPLFADPTDPRAARWFVEVGGELVWLTSRS